MGKPQRYEATTVYIYERQLAALRELNTATGVPQAEFIRRGVDLLLEREAMKEQTQSMSALELRRLLKDKKPLCYLPVTLGGRRSIVSATWQTVHLAAQQLPKDHRVEECRYLPNPNHLTIGLGDLQVEGT